MPVFCSLGRMLVNMGTCTVLTYVSTVNMYPCFVRRLIVVVVFVCICDVVCVSGFRVWFSCVLRRFVCTLLAAVHTKIKMTQYNN
jgi:hypothetical protein